jgi:hypothetical protein
MPRTDDPAQLTAEERFTEVAAILARSVLRLRKRRLLGPDPTAQEPTESGRKGLEAQCHQGLTGSRAAPRAAGFLQGEKNMALNIAKEAAAMERMTARELKERYAEVFGEVARTGNKQWLIKRIAWRLQANEQGDLSERARRRAMELANDADLRMKAPREPRPRPVPVQTTAVPLSRDPRLPMPGAVITRTYKNRTVEVAVHLDGFEYEGQLYKSLSAVARTITGTHLNGFLFFRLDGSGNGRAK